MDRTGFLVSGTAAAAFAAIPGIALASAQMTLATPTGNISGTLELPSSPGAVPVVLIVAGSGPTDRDGNSAALPGKNDSLKGLALGLARRGIASLRYDKRGVGASAPAGPAEKDLRFDAYVADAVAWLGELRAQKRFSRTIVAGHSEGALIGMLAAARAGADGYVSLEGLGRPAGVVLKDQLRHQAAQNPEAARRQPELVTSAEHAIDELTAGRTVSDVPLELATLFRPSVQAYLTSWFAYDPVREIAALRMPVAIVQGTADVQATRSDGDALHAALPAARYVVVEGMNHVLKHAPDTSPGALLAGYTDPSLPVESAVIDAVATIASG
ncbi:MAG: alpha/beta hydrolase [Candidatus Elarobacter sp.]